MEKLTKRVIDRVCIANPPIQCNMNKALFCDHAQLCDRVGKMMGRTCPALQMVDKLASYEDTGLEPEEIPTGLELANVFAALGKLKQYEAIGTVEQLGELQKQFDTVNNFLESQAAKLLEKNGKLQKALCALCRDNAKRDGNLLGCYNCYFKPSGTADAKVSASVPDAPTSNQSIPLPCKVGDKVRANVERPYNGNTATIHGAVSDIQVVIRVEYGEGRYIDFLASDFGKTVFINCKEVPQDG